MTLCHRPRVVWKNIESRDRVTLRNMLIAWVPHNVHIVYAWMTEIKSRV